jgi:hypothetical protein
MMHQAVASTFLLYVDTGRYGQVQADLVNNFSRGQDQYPTSLPSAYQLLLSYNNHQRNDSNRNCQRGGPPHGRFNRIRPLAPTAMMAQTPIPTVPLAPRYSFSQVSPIFKQIETTVNPPTTSPVQPSPNQSPCLAFNLAQIEKHFPTGIPPHYVIMDSASTVSIFCNPNFLSNIRNVSPPLCLQTNGGGSQLTHQMGTLDNIGDVWYNPASIANILSLEQVRCVRCVTMDTDTDPAFYVHKSDGGPTIFAEHPFGLYLHDVSDSTANQYSPVVTAHSYLQTVAQNKRNFTVCQVEAADASRKLYNMLG